MIPITSLDWSFVEILYLVIIFISGFLTTYRILPPLIQFMKKKGYVGKDIHKNEKPEVAESGGLSIVIGLIVGSILIIIFFPILVYEMLVFLFTIILSAFIGYIDDRIKLRSRYKIFLITLTGSAIFITNYFGFINIESPYVPVLGGLRLTIIYPLVAPLIVAIFANTVNMLEGYNGEGSGTCIIACVFIFICAILWNSAEGFILSLLAIAVLIPFYLFNRYPAKVFPGDIGTLTMGSMIACIALFGSIEVAVFCALLIHIFNSFYVISSVRGFFESSEIQEEKNDIILLPDDRIKASEQKDAALTLPRLILAKGPLKEADLVKNFYVISIICGFFSIIATVYMLYTMEVINVIILILVFLLFLFPTIFLLNKYPRIRGVVIFMIGLLGAGLIFMYFIDMIIMPRFTDTIDILFISIPTNLLISFLIAAPGFLVWYYLTIKYFFMEINKMKKEQ